jgi:hypothetical protein
MKRKIWDVEPRPNGRWAVQREGTTRADSLHDRKRARRSPGLGSSSRGATATAASTNKASATSSGARIRVLRRRSKSSGA